jgi:hypothetical protein
MELVQVMTLAFQEQRRKEAEVFQTFKKKDQLF